MAANPLRQNSAKNHPEKLSQMPPRLRSFIIYDDLPPGCIAFEAPDDTALPHLRAGEVAVIDTRDQVPMHGEMFLVHYQSSNQPCLLETTRRVIEAGPVWWLHPTNRQRSKAELKRRIRCGLGFVLSDGPYDAAPGRDQYVRDLIQGRVIGILEMDFRKRMN